MADKQIGIKLDMKQTGLQQVDDALDSISKNLSDMDEATKKQQRTGWGSEAQTKELREQLRAMEQMARLYERISRLQTVNPNGSGLNLPGNSPSPNGGGGGSNQYRSRTGLGGYAQNKWGDDAAKGVDKLTESLSKLSKIGAGIGGIGILSTMFSSLGRGDQLTYGYSDIYKRMGGSGDALKYGQQSILGLGTYGYDDLSVLGSAKQYSAITGRQSAGSLKDQMSAILGAGQRYGMDLSQVTQMFGNAFQTGITGGSGSQMNAQQFATLVANATVQAHMQGREGQMLDQVNAIAQMNIAAGGSAGDVRKMSALVGMGDATGNQAIISGLSGMLSNISQGITNPGGGYGGQALMMRAIGGGKMSFWQEQYQQSLGIDGSDSSYNGKTNIENATNYLMKTFKGDKYRQYAMLGQMFNLTPGKAKQYIDTYTKNGSFDSSTFQSMQDSLGNTPGNVPLTNVDKNRIEQQSKSNRADSNIGGGTQGMRAWIDDKAGDILGNPLASGVAMGLIGASGIGTAYRLGKGALGAGKWISKIFKGGGGGPVGPVSGAGGAGTAVGEVAAGAAKSGELIQAGKSVSTLAEGAGKSASMLGKLGKFGKFLGPIGEFATLKAVADFDGPDWLFGHKAGDRDYSGHGNYTDTKPGLFARLFKGSKTTTPADTTTQTSSNPTSGLNGSALAPIVVSTILALKPYMSQIDSALNDGKSSGMGKILPFTPKSTSATTNALLTPSNAGAGTVLASFMGGGGGGGTSGLPSSVSSQSTMKFSGKQKEFIDKMLPYAQQVSQKTGLPVDYVLSQWGFESGWGTSSVSKTNNNFAGIKPWKGAGAGANKTYAGYATVQDFANGYSDFYLKNGRYKDLITAAKGGASSQELTHILSGTGYAEDPNYEKKMNGIIGGVHKQVEASSASKAKQTSNKLQISGGVVTVHLKTDDGKVKTVKAPVTAEYTGLLA